MRKPAWMWLLVVGSIVVLLVISAAPSQAWSYHGGGRVFVGVYYCQSAQGYYPQVQSCPEPWVPVPPGNL
jgi:hypothetical protein